MTKERIAKAIAHAGLCSRRDAEKLILEGQVILNGALVTTPATLVSAEDKIVVKGMPLAKPEALRVWRYYKPVGLVVSHRDEKNRPTIFDALPSDLPRVISVGRLDLSSEGLILLTTSGALSRKLELPSTGWKRRYRVRIYGTPTPDQLSSLKSGITVEGIHYGPIEAQLDRQQGHNAWITMTLTEGKNREIRKIMQHFGWSVSRLIRLSYGPFLLGNLTPGEISEVSKKMLRESLGKMLEGVQ
ncbi:rRNA pseudouridine synthase [Candidatus Bealeia paramacronuclearis]|uniref:Pseudouridine synthase n=1 Tax=Candidatus Bealeia paramacronuclearis TaxID=1921001 RepID=A0ABZ2C1I2_9PROT|nr:rRNA pseudouridine synthase [Candidatus Bealeia paramacronuclearis]